MDPQKILVSFVYSANYFLCLRSSSSASVSLNISARSDLNLSSLQKKRLVGFPMLFSPHGHASTILPNTHTHTQLLFNYMCTNLIA